MRSYTNLILLSNIFDNFPDTIPEAARFADKVFNPSVVIVEADCNTQLGRLVSVAYEATGLVEVKTNKVITPERANELLSQGVYTVGVRSTYTCTSKKGICLADYKAAHPESDAKVNQTVKLKPESRIPFLTYIANTYSGSLMGIRPFPTPSIPIKPSLYDYIINDTELEEVKDLVFKSQLIPRSYIDYWPEIGDTLEKALYVLAIYRMFYQ